jgi:hypothetical protein
VTDRTVDSKHVSVCALLCSMDRLLCVCSDMGMGGGGQTSGVYVWGQNGGGKEGVGLAGQDRCIISCPTAPAVKAPCHERNETERERRGEDWA